MKMKKNWTRGGGEGVRTGAMMQTETIFQQYYDMNK